MQTPCEDLGRITWARKTHSFGKSAAHRPQALGNGRSLAAALLGCLVALVEDEVPDFAFLCELGMEKDRHSFATMALPAAKVPPWHLGRAGMLDNNESKGGTSREETVLHPCLHLRCLLAAALVLRHCARKVLFPTTKPLVSLSWGAWVPRFTAIALAACGSRADAAAAVIPTMAHRG